MTNKILLANLRYFRNVTHLTTCLTSLTLSLKILQSLGVSKETIDIFLSAMGRLTKELQEVKKQVDIDIKFEDLTKGFNE